MGSVADWLDFIGMSFNRIVICSSDEISFFSSPAAARLHYGSFDVYGMKTFDSVLYLFLYPIETKDMNLTLEVNYG